MLGRPLRIWMTHASSHFVNVFTQQFDHVAWRGCTFWDLIQPSFMFMVGVAMPFSYASRRARGETWPRLLGHAVLRSFILDRCWRSSSRRMGAGTLTSRSSTCSGKSGWHTRLFSCCSAVGPAFQFAAAVAILLADWLLFALYPFPGADFPVRPVWGVRVRSS